MAAFSALVFLCLFNIALSQISSPGPCPVVEPMKNFDMKQYMGRWYEAERYCKPDEDLEKCATTIYSTDKNGTIIEWETSTCALTGIVTSVPTYIKMADPKIANFTVKLRGRPVDVGFILLSTDYKTYSVLYDCDNELDQNNRTIHLTYSWVHTRAMNPPKAVMTKIAKVTDNFNLNRANFTRIRQDNCGLKPPK